MKSPAVDPKYNSAFRLSEIDYQKFVHTPQGSICMNLVDLGTHLKAAGHPAGEKLLQRAAAYSKKTAATTEVAVKTEREDLSDMVQAIREEAIAKGWTVLELFGSSDPRFLGLSHLLVKGSKFTEITQDHISFITPSGVLQHVRRPGSYFSPDQEPRGDSGGGQVVQPV